MKRVVLLGVAFLALGSAVGRADEDVRDSARMPLQRASIWGEFSQGQEDRGFRLVRRDGLAVGLSFQGSILGVPLEKYRLRGGDLLGFSFGAGGMSSDYKNDDVNYTLSLTAGLQLWYLLDNGVDLGVFGGARADYFGTAGGAFQPGSRAIHLFLGAGARWNRWGVELSAGELGFLHVVTHLWFWSGRSLGLEYTHLQQADSVGAENPKFVNALRFFLELQL
jgi:hypothetical protein